MPLTKKYKNDLEKAIRCAESGEAYHWPTIAAILADEIKRLRNIVTETTTDKDSLKTAYCPQCGKALSRCKCLPESTRI